MLKKTQLARHKSKDIHPPDIFGYIQQGTNCLLTVPDGTERMSLVVDIAHEFISKGRHLWDVVHPNALSPYRVFWLEGAIDPEFLSVRSLWRTDNAIKNVTIWSVDILRDNLPDVLSSEQQNQPDLLILENLECLGEPDIGSQLEEIILRLPKSIPILALMSLVPNIQDILSWLEKVCQRPCRWIKTKSHGDESVLAFLTPERSLIPLCTKRKVATKVKRYLKENRPMPTVAHSKFVQPLLSMLQKEKMTPTIIFMSSDRECDKAVSSSSAVKAESGNVLTSPQIAALFERHPMLKDREDILAVLSRRAGSLHSAHHPDWCEMIEVFLSMNHIDAVFSTIDAAQTLMTGVKSIVLTTSQVDTHDSNKRRQITKRDLSHVLKLLGKQDVDDLGCIVFVNTRDMDIVRVKELLTSKPDPILSQFQCNCQTLLGLHATDKTNPDELLSYSLLADQKRNADNIRLNELLIELKEKIPESNCSSPRAAIALMDIYSRLKMQIDKTKVTIKKDKNIIDREKAEKIIAELQVLISQLPCESCVHQQECQKMKYRKIRTIVNEYYDILHTFKNNHPFIDIDFNDYKLLLTDFKFIDANQRPTDRGLLALRTGLKFPQLVVESVQKGMIPLDDSALSSALVAGFVELSAWERPQLIDDFIDQPLIDAYTRINEVIIPAKDRLLRSGFFMEAPILAQSAAMLAWKKGIDMDTLAAQVKVSLGSLARLIQKEKYLKRQLYSWE